MPLGKRTPAGDKDTQMELDASKTAMIVVDMWDNHYCKTMAEYADELAYRLNMVLWWIRAAHVPILFMAEDVLPSHEHEVGARLLSSYQFLYCNWIAIEHPPAPGHHTWWNQCLCDDGEKCLGYQNWTRLHPTVRRNKYDLVGGWSQHTGFIRAHGIDTLLYAGMCSNICVLDGRHFSVCQSIGGGMNCVVLEDLIEGYTPVLGREEGHKQIVEYYRQHICPVVLSSEITFRGDGIWSVYNEGKATP